MSPKASKTPSLDLDIVGQHTMFHDTSGDAVRELARTYLNPVDKSHGVKAFAMRLFPKKSDSQAYTRLMNCTNPKTGEVFDDDDWREVIRIGHEQDKHCVIEYFAGAWYDLKPRLTEAVKQRRKAYRRWLLDELKRCEDE